MTTTKQTKFPLTGPWIHPKYGKLSTMIDERRAQWVLAMDAEGEAIKRFEEGKITWDEVMVFTMKRRAHDVSYEAVLKWAGDIVVDVIDLKGGGN